MNQGDSYYRYRAKAYAYTYTESREYRMVPAWIFLGYEELHFKDGKSKIQEPEPGQLYPYAVINALDGSIINIAEGY